MTFDHFHVKQKLSEAIVTVRRAEAKEQKELLKNTRYLWLKRPKNLTAKQLDWLDALRQQPLRTARAYEQALKFDHFYELDAGSAAEYLRRWIEESERPTSSRFISLPTRSSHTGRGCCAGITAASTTGCWRDWTRSSRRASDEPESTDRRVTTRQ